MTVAELIRLIASLFAALFAPARLLARVTGLDARRLRRLASFLERMKRAGRYLAYEGEDDATILRRIDRAAWMAADPIAAMKHIVRGHRGLIRLRFGMVAPASFAPPVLAIAPIGDGNAEIALDDTS